MDDTTIAADGIVREVRDLVEDYIQAEIVSFVDPRDGTQVPAIRKGTDVVAIPASTFDPYRSQPLRRTGIAELFSLDSLIDHVKRFSDPDSVVFAIDDRAMPSITAVIDYHRLGADGARRFGLHRSHYKFPVSDEWKAWREKDAAPMSMVDFAEFLENRIIDVLYLIPNEDSLPEDMQRLVDTLGGNDIIATPNKLIELSRGLQINEAAVVQEAQNLASGEGIVRFQTEHTDAAGNALRVPALFLIGIPVFRNGQLYRIAARLRYRKAGGKIVFWYELWRIDRTFDAAFSEAIERVRVETELPVLIGKPEA